MDASDDAPSQKKLHMCQCDCYNEGTLKPFYAPSARMPKTNQHVGSLQPQFLHKTQSSFCPSTMQHNIAAQIMMKKGSHLGQPPFFTQTKLKESDQATQPRRTCHTLLSPFLHTRPIWQPHIYQASCISWHSMSTAMWQLSATFANSQMCCHCQETVPENSPSLCDKFDNFSQCTSRFVEVRSA